MNLRVNLTKRIRTAEGLRYCSVVESANGRIKPDWVVVDGQEEKHPEGAYYIEWREGGKRSRLSVGKDAAQAQARRLRKRAELNAVAKGVTVVPDSAESTDGRPLAEAMATYLEEVALTKKPKTLAAYTTALGYFAESCHRLSVEHIVRADMLKFAAFLRDKKNQAPRSVYNKFENVMTFLKWTGVRNIVNKGDWPRFTEEEPEVYEKDDIEKLMAVSDTQEKLWWDFFLMTGMREQEVMYTMWRDVNLEQRTISVKWKPEYTWTPKQYKEREIPVPAKLINALKHAKTKATRGCPLVFPTAGCKPKFDFLDCLKAVAKRAKLDESEFYLHKFRATFATWHLWAGIDLRTVQLYMGHTDIESTMRYLKPSRSQATRDKVDATFA
jgi:integrase/recombinase XerD